MIRNLLFISFVVYNVIFFILVKLIALRIELVPTLDFFFPNSVGNKFEARIAHHFKFNHPNRGSVFRFYIFRNDIFNVFDRLNLESQLILLFKHLKVKIVNQRINSPYYWKTNLSLFNITNN